MAKSVILPATFAISLFISFTASNAQISTVDSGKQSSCSEQQRNQRSIECEVEEAKLKIVRLESILNSRIAEVESKNQYFRECEKKIEALDALIDNLNSALSSYEHDYADANRKLRELEEEVRLLWSASRKNNFEIHSLEYKALDAERRLKEATLQATEMAEIVSELWIQIQQLEQAVHMAEMRTSKIRKELWTRCPFVKFFVTLYEECLERLKGMLDDVPRVNSLLDSFRSRTLRALTAAKCYHHQLQSSIKTAMRRNEVTAMFAHEEVVFVVASALIVFPIMTACMLLLSQFG